MVRGIGSACAAVAFATTALAACGKGSAADGGVRAVGGRTAQADGPADRAETQRTFRDWYAVCDNGNACYAFGHATEGTGWVRVSIPAGPDGRPTVIVGLWPEGQLVRPLSARVDGRDYPASIVGDEGEEDESPVATIDPDVAVALIDAMTQGTAMTVVAGPDSVTVSLSGAAASMLWIDERQGRLGTTTALIRKGARPASTVPAAPALVAPVPAPAISQAGYGDQEGQVLPAAIERLTAVQQCRSDTDFNPDLQKVISSARLDADTVLWSVPCGAGAYNFSNAWFLTDTTGANPRRVTFPTASGATEDLLVNAAYDPASRTMDAFNKGRGLGDCGNAATWTWTGRAFVLRSSSDMNECWGVPSDYWPMTWVSE